MKIHKISTVLTVVFDNGDILSNTNCNQSLYQEVLNNLDNEEKVRDLLCPEFAKKKEIYEEKKQALDKMKESKILTVKGQNIYMLDICELTVPIDLAEKILEAELNGDEDLITSYKNFWTLCALNPDSRVRNNLFWFLSKYGMQISKSGLFVAYKNVKLKNEGKSISTKWAKFITKNYTKVKFKWKKKPQDFFIGKNEFGERILIHHSKENSPSFKIKGNLQELYNSLSNVEESPVYTDAHSQTFTIKIGEPVTMPREECDPVQENTCSRGLHLAGKSWLQNGYFGDNTIIVLVNPADVVAVP